MNAELRNMRRLLSLGFTWNYEGMIKKSSIPSPLFWWSFRSVFFCYLIHRLICIGNLSFFNSVGIKSDKLLLHCIGCVVCDSPLTEIQYANLARRTASDTSICPFAVLASKNTNILWDLSTSMLSFVLSPAWMDWLCNSKWHFSKW